MQMVEYAKSQLHTHVGDLSVTIELRATQSPPYLQIEDTKGTVIGLYPPSHVECGNATYYLDGIVTQNLAQYRYRLLLGDRTLARGTLFVNPTEYS